MKKALFYGILASLFFAFTFVLNRSMNLSGGYWLWSACLRYLFTLPLLWLLTAKKGGTAGIRKEIRSHAFSWLLWSTVGFGFFYVPLTLASVYGESWFVAATWQLTIVAGILLTPLFGKKLPIKNLLWSGVILGGIFLLQTSHFASANWKGMLFSLGLILIAAFSYPLGNRKMMACCPQEITTLQRVFGMTLCSMPFWLILSLYALATHGLPSPGQTAQSLVVAAFSGVAATVLFFAGTDLTRHDPKQLAVVEATQSGEVIFALLGGILFLGDPLPSPLGFAGISIIVIGMIGNSLASA
ncbi:MAG: multidrug resistance efflux transporter family protein [Eubacteriales bacterium]|nr:multidrug resistance efflux transporter family protein [Eubacteriales bacterium]